MNGFGKALNVILALVAGFFGTIYISAPVFMSIYNNFLLKTTNLPLSKEAVVGFILLVSIFKLNISKNEIKEEEGPEIIWAKLIIMYIAMGIIFVMSLLYKAYLG